MTDLDYFSSLIGLEMAEPDQRFRTEVVKRLAAHPDFPRTDLPPNVLERILFAAVKESFPEQFEKQSPALAATLLTLYSGASNTAREAQNQALGKGVVARPRQDQLRGLIWTVVEAPSEGAVLPDCVALATSGGNEAQPYMFCGDDFKALITPITSEKLLLGLRPGAAMPDLSTFNTQAASCSEDFIVAASRPPEAQLLSSLIGTRSSQLIDEVSTYAISRTFVQDSTSSKQHAEEAADVQRPRSGQDFGYQVSFLGFAEEAAIQSIAGAVQCIVSRYAQIAPLSRLDGITLAFDYERVLQELDRGFEASRPLRTVSEEVGLGIAQAPIIIRDGVIKIRIIMRGEYGAALISDDPFARDFALHALIFQLAEAAFIEMLDNALPGVLLTKIEDQLDGELWEYLSGAITAYFAGRGSAGLAADGPVDALTQDLLLAALERTRNRVREAKVACRSDGDVRTLYDIGLDAAREILHLCASLIGYRTELRRPLLVEGDVLTERLTQQGLAGWFRIFSKDLDELWTQRGKWTSFRQFLDLNRHVERLLWQFGLVSWRLSDGRTYVRFFLT